MYNRTKKISTNLTTLVLTLVFVMGLAAICQAAPKPKPKMIKAVMLGDRLVDVAYNLGVLPEYMSVRGSMWPMAGKIKAATQIVGCPKCVVSKRPHTIPDLVMKKGIKRVIIEKSANFCLYMPSANPVKVVPLLKDTDATIEYVDFSKGVVPAIRQLAKLLNVEEKGEKLITSYQKAYKAVESGLPEQGLGKKVVILNGVYSKATGKTFLSVEAPGGYADQYMLAPLGCTNAGAAFAPPSGAVSRGMYRVRTLKALTEAKPDVIVVTGAAWAVQVALQKQIKKNPALLSVPALKTGAVFTLPRYIDGSVVEYPCIFNQWKAALSN
jgi:ABC-type Fe3+-hydroxamate transport system substrate-binding protein